jgi:hypothetical protein
MTNVIPFPVKTKPELESYLWQAQAQATYENHGYPLIQPWEITFMPTTNIKS